MYITTYFLVFLSLCLFKPGPLLNEDLAVVRMPFQQYKDLTFSLSGMHE